MLSLHQRRGRMPVLAALAAALAFTACSDDEAIGPDPEPIPTETARLNQALAAMRGATARYHDISVALEEGFIQVHGCEEREGEAAPVGIPFAHPDRMADGVIDPAQPEALLYEPGADGSMTLVGVELVMPYDLWQADEPPEFFGAKFQPEDEFGVWGLHVWVWRENPNGVFAPGNVNITCNG